MFFITWFILALGLVLNCLVFYWNGNLRNGSRTGAPFYFIKYAGLYALFDIILFFLLFLINQIKWYIVLILYLLSMIVGVIISEKKYKNILNEIINEEENEKGKKFTKEEREKKLKNFYETQKIIQKNKY